MNTYYCYKCASASGILPSTDVKSLNLTGSSYLLQKFMEHTVPSAGAGKTKNSLYDDATYDAYKNYCVSGSASGSVEIQPDGKKNLIWYAGEKLGPSFENGTFNFDGDTVKIVYPENTGKLHHFHVDSNDYKTVVCATCGGPLLS
jgi:hypothetical protein